MYGRCQNEMTPKRKLSRKPAKLQQHMIYGQVGGVSPGLIVGIGKAGYGITKALGDHQTKRSIKKLPKSAEGREDINVDAKRIEVNERVKLTAVDDNFTYIDNSVIDASALNGSRLHLNAKGSSLLAVQFIKFLRSGSGKYNQSLKGFQSSAIQQLVKLLMELGNLPSPARNRRRPR